MRNLNIVSNYPEVEAQCEYCRQFQNEVKKYCDFCGAPIPDFIQERVTKRPANPSGFIMYYRPVASTGPPAGTVK